MTRREAYDLFKLAATVLTDMSRYDDAELLLDAATWLDPSFSLCTLDDIRGQAQGLRNFTYRHAGVEGRIGSGPITVRARLFVVEVLRSIEA